MTMSLPVTGRAMQFEPVALSPADLVVFGRGPTVAGDADRLNRALTAVPAGQNLLGLALDSGGGNVAESKQMVGIIRARRLTVVIAQSSQCASACFLMLAASPRRLAGSDALIGVHSASENGIETELAMAETTRMAREAASLGVPPAVIGKMVETSSARVEWLAPQDLAAMKVTIYQGDLLAELRQPKPAAPAAMPDGPPPDAPAGGADHRAWDVWLAGLRGAYRDGAMFAQSQGADVQPEACYGPGNVNRGDFTQGCQVAQQRLAAILAKSRISADYAQGWNDAVQHATPLPAPAPVPPASNADLPVEQEYKGVFFCAAQIGQLTLRVFQRSDPSVRSALVLFGPHDSQTGPHGSFMVMGTAELTGGAMSLKPVTWVSQPAGSRWFGVSGSSEDGGKTFLGRVTDNTTCTRFTLARTGNARAAR
jgi:hypothetical protein